MGVEMACDAALDQRQSGARRTIPVRTGLRSTNESSRAGTATRCTWLVIKDHPRRLTPTPLPFPRPVFPRRPNARASPVGAAKRRPASACACFASAGIGVSAAKITENTPIPTEANDPCLLRVGWNPRIRCATQVGIFSPGRGDQGFLGAVQPASERLRSQNA